MPPPYPIQIASTCLPRLRTCITASSPAELTLCRREANSDDHIISVIGFPLTRAEHPREEAVLRYLWRH